MTPDEPREDPGEEARFRSGPAGRRRRRPAARGPPPRPAFWWAPALSALAPAMVLGLVALPLLPRAVEPDPFRSMVSAVLSQHARSLMWGEARPEAVPAAVPRGLGGA